MIWFFKRKKLSALWPTTENLTHLALLADGRLKAEPLITGKIKLDDIVENGFKELLKNRESNIKILVSP